MKLILILILFILAINAFSQVDSSEVIDVCKKYSVTNATIKKYCDAGTGITKDNCVSSCDLLTKNAVNNDEKSETFTFSSHVYGKTKETTYCYSQYNVKYLDRVSSIESESYLNSISNEVVQLVDGKTTSNSSEIYTNKDEYDYKRDVCLAAYDQRAGANLDFIKNSLKFSKETLGDNLPLFSILYQMVKSKKFPMQTCLDYKEVTVGKKYKLSFSFKGSFLSGDSLKSNFDNSSTAVGPSGHLVEVEKIGGFFNKFILYPKKVSSVVTDGSVKYPDNVYIHGFADQQLYSAEKTMKYLNDKKVEKTQYYLGSTGGLKLSDTPLEAKNGLYDSVIESKTLDYPVLDELTQLEEKLKNRHMVFPFGETTDQLLLDSYKRYISDVEVNELLALNRAVQTKRALKKAMPDYKFSPLIGGKNSSSSCKNMLIYKYPTLVPSDPDPLVKGLINRTDTCARRRKTVIEADFTTYSQGKAEIKPTANIVGLNNATTGVYFYANCAVGNAGNNFSLDTFKYVLGSKKGSIHLNKAKSHSTSIQGTQGYNAGIHERLSMGENSIVDIILKENTDLKKDNEDNNQIYTDIQNSISTYETYNVLSNLKYKLSLSSIAEILSLPLFEFHTFPRETEKVSGSWTLDLLTKSSVCLEGSKGLNCKRSWGNNNDFSYFMKTHLYLDKGCSFTKEYRLARKDKRPVSYDEVYKLISTTPFGEGQLHKIESKDDCVVANTELNTMIKDCKSSWKPPLESEIKNGELAKYIFPFLGFDESTQEEVVIESKTEEIMDKVIKRIGGDAATIDNAIIDVNSILCTTMKATDKSYEKPTSNEQEDCK